MIRRPGRVIGIAAAAALVLTLALVGPWREPRWEGRSVSHWLRALKVGVKVLAQPDGTYTVMLPNLSDEELAALKISSKVKTVPSNMMASRFFPNWPDQIDFSQASKPDEDPANQAIGKMGAVVLPRAMADLRSRESKGSAWLCQWVWPRLPGRVQRWIGKPMHPIHKRVNAAYALGLLGGAGRPAIPELQRLVKEDEDPLVRAVARESLHRIDPGIAGPFYPELFDSSRAAPKALEIGKPNDTPLFDSGLSLHPRSATVEAPDSGR